MCTNEIINKVVVVWLKLAQTDNKYKYQQLRACTESFIGIDCVKQLLSVERLRAC